jgi:hypothetical protein
MGLPRNDKKSNLPSGDSRLSDTAGAMSSLNEAWFHTLDRCVTDSPLGEVIFPLMRDCFFGGAMHAVLLMQKGHGDQLTSDIADYIREEPVIPEVVQVRSPTGTYRKLRDL